MIPDIKRGRGFRGVLEYTLEERHQPEPIAGNMAGRDARALAAEFRAGRELRPDVARPVFHASLSWHPSERVTNAQMAAAARRYLEGMGYDTRRNQYTVVRHNDRPHPHCHIVASRIRLDDASLVRIPLGDYRRSAELARSIERDLGFRQVERTRRDLAGERHPTRGEGRMLRDRGLHSDKEQLKQAIRRAAHDRPTMKTFAARLQAAGVEVRVNIARTGHISGVSYRLSGGRVAVKGSQLGRDFTWQGLQRTLGVRYEPGRDQRHLQALTPRDRTPADRAAPARLAALVARQTLRHVPGGRAALAALNVTRTLSSLVGPRHDAPARVHSSTAARAAALVRALQNFRQSPTRAAGEAVALAVPKLGLALRVADALQPSRPRSGDGPERDREIPRSGGTSQDER